MKALLLQASSFGLCQMALVLKARINRLFHRPGNFKGVAGVKILTKLYPYKCRSKSPISSTFGFNCISNSNVKVGTIFLRKMVFVVRTRRTPVNSVSWLF